MTHCSNPVAFLKLSRLQKPYGDEAVDGMAWGTVAWGTVAWETVAWETVAWETVTWETVICGRAWTAQRSLVPMVQR